MFKTINKRKGLYIISIEGLDAAGKETFKKSLEIEINKHLKAYRIEDSANISSVSFPRYETHFGQTIKEQLKKPVSQRDQEMLLRTFADDKIDFMCDYMKTKYDENKLNVIIIDRYIHSSLIYKPLFDGTDLSVDKYGEIIVDEISSLPTPNITAIFNRESGHSTDIHRLILSKKSDKDVNETEEVQNLISNNIRTVFGNIRETTDEVISIPIGCNFNNINYEMDIIHKLVRAIDKYNVDRVSCPSSITLNSLDEPIHEETPDLLVKIEPDPEHTKRIHNIMKDYQQCMKYTTDIVDEDTDLIRSLDNLMQFTMSYKPLKEFNQEFLESLVNIIWHSGKTHSEIRGTEYLNLVLDRLLFIPKKVGNGNSSYKLLTTIPIVLEPRGIEKINLGYSISKIEKLNIRDKNKNINIDLRTAGTCVLKYGVSIADSPSSVASNFKGDISVILVNHRDTAVTIPIGTPVASLILGRPSYVAEFI